MPCSALSVETIRDTVERCPAGNTAMASPGAMLPAAMVPAKPRKFESGRHTHCTGMRKPMSCAVRATCTVSRCSSNDGPVYQGVDSDAASMLSPLSADSGMQVTSGMPSVVASSR